MAFCSQQHADCKLMATLVAGNENPLRYGKCENFDFTSFIVCAINNKRAAYYTSQRQKRSLSLCSPVKKTYYQQM